jgi:hypothetical protein
VERVEHRARDVEVEEQEVTTEVEDVVGVSRVVRWVREEHPRRIELDKYELVVFHIHHLHAVYISALLALLRYSLAFGFGSSSDHSSLLVVPDNLFP